MHDTAPHPAQLTVGVVGLGLMGCSICTCLLMAGHRVVAIAPLPSDLPPALPRIHEQLADSLAHGLIQEEPDELLSHFTLTEQYSALANCRLVIECVIENIAIKEQVYGKIEVVIAPDALLTSNTSAIPISQLQALTQHPERFLGLHWAEPSHTTRFLEIICGEKTDPVHAEWLYALAHHWNKEPTLVRKDIRGFIANRLMYAMYREAMYLVEEGYASVEDIDRACRNNTGYWMTLVGVFRWMDLTGVPAYHKVMQDLLPTLHNGTDVPPLIDDIVQKGGKGIANGQGFYTYTPEEARLWEETFREFSYKIRELALQYPHDVVQKKVEEGE